MPETPSPSKDVADLLEALAQRLRTDPGYVAAQENATDAGGVTVYAGPGGAYDRPMLGEVDFQEDDDHISVTAETNNVEPHAVHVTLSEDRLFIGLGEGLGALKRDFPLPAPVDEEKAVATFRNGILDIVLPLRSRRK